MNKRIIVLILNFNLILMAMTVTSFAETKEISSKSIQTAEQLKAEINVCMEDGEMTGSEKETLLAQTTKEAAASLMSEKLDMAV